MQEQNVKGRREKCKGKDDGIKMGLHSSWTQHSFSYILTRIFYIEYIVRVLVVC